MYAYFADLFYFANKVEERMMMNMESDMENESYLKLMQKDEPPTSATYAIVEPLHLQHANQMETYAFAALNTCPSNHHLKAMKRKSPYSSASSSSIPALNLETTPGQHARIMKNVAAKRLAKLDLTPTAAKKLAKQPLQGDQEDAEIIAQRLAGMQRVLSHLRQWMHGGECKRKHMQVMHGFNLWGC